MENNFKISILCFLFFLVSCKKATHQEKNKEASNSLPVLSPKVKGTYQKIAPFSFVNQNKQVINSEFVKNKIYVAEFFFTSCPSICPKVSAQLQQVYNTFKNEPNFCILSHSIDPKHDTVEQLKKYYTNTLNLQKPSNWHLLTGNKQEIYDLANFSYGAVVYEDLDKLQDNIMHSGALLLIDKTGLIRGMYDGKDQENTQRLIKDITVLLQENNS